METRVFTYRAGLSWRGDRTVENRSDDRADLVVTPPPDFPGGTPDSWSPEHLFLASLQSCTALSFLAHCAHNGIEVVSYESTGEAQLARRDEDRRYAFEGVALIVMVRVAGGHAPAARGLTGKAERDCFISASTTAEVETDWRIIE